jgi:hypothetical protein
MQYTLHTNINKDIHYFIFIFLISNNFFEEKPGTLAKVENCLFSYFIDLFLLFRFINNNT